jgi:hypothetical protein
MMALDWRTVKNATPHVEAGAVTLHELVAAPGHGKRLVITRLLFSNNAVAGSIAFLADCPGTPVPCGPTWYPPVTKSESLACLFVLAENVNFGVTSVTCTSHSFSCEYYVKNI